MANKCGLRVDVVPIIGKNGNIEGTQSAIRDITERKRAAQSLLESEQRFRFVANSAPVMIWIAGTDKLCSYVNQQWLDFTGRSLDAELGSGWSRFRYFEPPILPLRKTNTSLTSLL